MSNSRDMGFVQRFLIIAAGGIVIWALGGVWVSSLAHHRPMDWVQSAFAAAIWVMFALFWAWMGHRGGKMRRQEQKRDCIHHP